MELFRKKSTWLIFLPILIFIPFMANFVFPYGGEFSDVAITHFPNAKYIQKSIIEFHQIPLWSNTIMAGYPFAANPLSNLFYPPHWLAILLPLPLGLNLLCALHIALGGLGMYAFLKEQEIADGPAILGALSFEMMPKLVLHFAAGHISTVYAVSWYPWLLVFEQRVLNEKEQKGSRAKIFCVLGLIILADVRWAPYGFLLWFFYGLYYRLIRHKKDYKGQIHIFGKWILQAIINVFTACCLALVLILPMMEYTFLSTRQQLLSEDHFIFSMPVSRLLGFVIPDFHGFVEWTVYPGLIAICLLIVLFSNKALIKKQLFWLLTILFACLFSLGDQILLNELITNLPGFNLLRVPPRVHILTGFAFSIISAQALNCLIDQRNKLTDLKNKQSIRRWLFVVCSTITLLSIGIWFITKKAPYEYLWASLVLIIGSILINWVIGKDKKNRLLILSIIGLAIIDLLIVNVSNLEFKQPATVADLSPVVAERLLAETGYFRTYSPSYSLEQQQSINYGLELVDGIDPMQLMDYQKYMIDATGVQSKGYGVTIPTFENGVSSTDNRNAIPDAELLGLLNVKYVISAFPINASGLNLLIEADSEFVYENDAFQPRVWIERENGNKIEVDEVDILPNRISITAAGPGKLVLSEIYYPGWQAWIDGEKAEVEKSYNILRSIHLEAGEHEVEMKFRSTTLMVGMIISALSWAMLLSYITNARKYEKKF